MLIQSYLPVWWFIRKNVCFTESVSIFNKFMQVHRNNHILETADALRESTVSDILGDIRVVWNYKFLLVNHLGVLVISVSELMFA